MLLHVIQSNNRPRL